MTVPAEKRIRFQLGLLQAAIQEIDPTATFTFELHDELTIHCAQEHADAIRELLAKLPWKEGA